LRVKPRRRGVLELPRSTPASAFSITMLTHLKQARQDRPGGQSKGDLHVGCASHDEDIGICLGDCLLSAVSDKKGIARYGHSSVPIGGRPGERLAGPAGPAGVRLQTSNTARARSATSTWSASRNSCGRSPTAANSTCTCNLPYGTNSHHIAEANLQGPRPGDGRGCQDRRGTDIPSTKGRL